MLTVFGSINLDVTARVARMPRTGETVMGGRTLLSPGGKGANQAHAAQLFGVPTRLFGAVGDDAFAAPALACLRAGGVDVRGVLTLAGQATGMALITVDAAADNTIVVSPGANQGVRADQVDDGALAASCMVLMQLEVPLPECVRLMQRARRLGCRVILNASPVAPALHLAPGCADLLIVNEIELRSLCGGVGLARDDPGDVLAQAGALARVLDLDVLVTLGPQGSAWLGRDGTTTNARAWPVKAVDTVGAGDTYAGVLAAALAQGQPRQLAMDTASVAAALCCLREGAQLAQPTRQEIEVRMRELGLRGQPSAEAVKAGA